VKHLFVGLLVAFCGYIAPACAESSEARTELDARAYGLYQQVLSPFCPGRSLNDCPSSKAQDLKIQMRQKLEQGLPEAAILEDVFSTFGEQYRAVPHYAGFGKLVWWVPAGFVALGFALILLITRGRRTSPTRTAGAQQNVGLSSEMQAKIKSELDALDN